MRAREVVILGVVGLAGSQAPATLPAAARAADIYLAPFVEGPGKTTRIGFIGIQRHGISVGKPIVNITNHPGDDDHPNFLPDSSALLFSANRDGRQRDIYRYDLASKNVVQVTQTPEDEWAPIVAPDGRTFTTIRGAEARLWRFAIDGSNPFLAWESPGPVTAHAWLSPTDVAVVVANGQQSQLQLVDLGNRQTHVIDSRVGHALFLRPGNGTVTYLRHEDDSDWIREVDPATRVMRGLTDTLKGSADFACTPTGTLIMGQQSKVFSWEEDSDHWIELTNLDKSGIGKITRIAISPDSRWIAIVAEPTRR